MSHIINDSVVDEAIADVSAASPRSDMVELSTMSLRELAEYVKGLKSEIDALQAKKTALQEVYDAVTMGIIPDKMEDQGISTANIAGVGRIQLTPDIWCSVPAAKADDLKEWFRAAGMGSMMSTVINSSTLKAWVKRQIKEGKEYPRDLLKITPFTRATVVKT